MSYKVHPPSLYLRLHIVDMEPTSLVATLSTAPSFANSIMFMATLWVCLRARRLRRRKSSCYSKLNRKRISFPQSPPLSLLLNKPYIKIFNFL
uniref:Uncharacterized protein n=1 Tax=Zea mays TaxID=4577 RepID=B6TM84_MAIZE|nr:hypothetical protein [Zea mays]